MIVLLSFFLFPVCHLLDCNYGRILRPKHASFPASRVVHLLVSQFF